MTCPGFAAHDLAGPIDTATRPAADRPASSPPPRPNPTLPPYRVSEFARVLADGDPQTWITLRAWHMPGSDGRCAVCRSSRQPAERWPCTLRAIADQAADLAAHPDIGDPADRVGRKRITASTMTTDEQLMTATTILIGSVHDLLPQIHEVIRQHPTDAYGEML